MKCDFSEQIEKRVSFCREISLCNKKEEELKKRERKSKEEMSHRGIEIVSNSF